MVKMDKRVKKAWTDALRSGEYTQGQCWLRSRTISDGENRFCCLGVLCDLHSKETGSSWLENNGEFLYLDSQALLPPEVATWAGLNDPDVLCKVVMDEGEPGEYELDVAIGYEREFATHLNDNGCSFSYIAGLIESSL